MEKQGSSLIRDFTPIWFASILGFGGIALTTVLVAQIFDVPSLNPFAYALVYLNLALFVFLFLMWISKAILYFSVLINELRHPVIAGFHSLMPAAMIMVSINFSRIGHTFSLWQYQNISVIFWIIGAALEFVLLTLTIFFLIINEKMNLDFLNGGWLVPPVAGLLTTIAGLHIVAFIPDIRIAENIVWINYFFFGTGTFIFILLAFSIFNKIFFSERLDPKLIPSLWIMLVPFSLVSLCFPLFADSTGSYLPHIKNTLAGIGLFISPMLIGIGAWLLILFIILTYYYFTYLQVPYTVGWWAFIFPTASVSMASLSYAMLVQQSFFAYLGVAIYVALLAISLIVIMKTIKSLTGADQ